MKSSKFIEIINQIAPESTQEEWDNSGYQINLHKTDYRKILVALEITEAVIDEAIEADVDLILTHHPTLFNPLKSLDSLQIPSSYIYRLCCEGIDLYACHTPFDKAEGGLNDYLATRLGLVDIGKFEDESNDICRIGRFAEPLSLAEAVALCERALSFDKKYFRIVEAPNQEKANIDIVGLCTGAGAEYIRDAAREGCKLFITGDVKHHEAQDAREIGLNILDCGHYGTEKIFTDNMCKLLVEQIPSFEDVELIKSQVDVNPFKC
ncbi:MAG TPA: Nif3-like dinuclear metal center hexameric protein [Anaerovoracaceae bacterium]|nr:Nif3-like dinuclear metal center hexameric protein [Anaerovoracaceae bacterium]